MMTQENFAQLLQFFKLLGNESRLQIIGLLANRERSVGELAEVMALTEPTVSHHLSMMKEIGLVGVRAEGTVRIYWLDTAFLDKMNKDMFSQSHLANLIDVNAENAWEQRILQTFIEGRTIKQLPARREKKLVILKWLVTHFEEGVRYPEPEMNRLLKEFHDDHAALRRYLVENGLMTREKGIYWRL